MGTVMILIYMAIHFSSCFKKMTTMPEPVNIPPRCEISQPLNGAAFTMGDTLDIQVDADNDARVRVERDVRLDVAIWMGQAAMHLAQTSQLR